MRNKKVVDFLLTQAKERGIKDNLVDYVNEILCAKKVEIAYYNGYWSIENIDTYTVIIDEEVLDLIAEEEENDN